MAERFTIQAINSIEPDTATDVVHVECMTNGANAEVDVHSGALSTLTLGLLQASQAFSANTEEYSGQPLELTGAGLVTLEDGSFEALGNGGPEAMLAFDLQEPCRAR
jgi:hypothetical protein